MANLASALKEEVGRLARKEIRQQTAGTARTAARCERDIATLKRQIEDLQRKLSSLRTQDTPKQTTSTKTPNKKATTTKKQAAQPASGFRPAILTLALLGKGLEGESGAPRTFRRQLRQAYRCLGVVGLQLGAGKGPPRRESSIAALMTIRGIGKREAAKRLEALASPQPDAKTTTKAKAKPKANRKSKDSKARAADNDKAEGES